MKKLSYAVMLLIGLMSINSEAQTFTWGNPFQSSKETGSTLQHCVSGGVFQINIRYNDKIFNKEVTVNNLDIAKLDKIKTIDLSLKQPAMGLNTASILELFQVNGVDFIMFTDDFNTKTKERELSYLKVNIETGVKTDPVLITKMPTRNSNYYIVQSPNKQFYAVMKQYSFDKKLNEKLNVVVFDKNLKQVNEISFETAYMNREQSGKTHYVTNQGNVFIVDLIEQAKEKPFKTIYFWDNTKTAMTETSLKFDNDYQLDQYKGHFLGDDFYLQGLYTRIGSKAVQMYGGSKPVSGFLVAKFNSKGEKIYIERNETGEIAGVRMKNFVFDGLKTWFFGDKFFENKKAKPMVPGQSFNFEYDYSYHNTSIFFARLDNETGKLEYFKDLPFDEPNTTNDNGRYLSYLYFIRNNQLTFLYNDTQKTQLGKRTFNDRFISIDVYDDRGNSVSKSLIPDNGLEIEYQDEYYGTLKDNFDLDTSVNVFVQDGKYIVRAKSPSNEKYGYLKF